MGAREQLPHVGSYPASPSRAAIHSNGDGSRLSRGPHNSRPMLSGSRGCAVLCSVPGQQRSIQHYPGFQRIKTLPGANRSQCGLLPSGLEGCAS
jgi:hypothetical protein